MTVPSTEPKDKTIAKKRYLRRKRDRRKHRSKVSKGSRATSNTRENVASADSDSDAETVDVPTTTKSHSHAPPPSKRQKMLEEASVHIHAMDVDTTDENDRSEPVANVDEEQSQSDAPAEDSMTLQPALPTFPLPAPPNAPSKAELALQGLDQALVEAELIDSSYLLRVPSQDDSDELGLSGKMKKRLKELGIQEFFAVQASLLPYLLKNNPPSPLYMPYDPPRDVCVSAPTGSGKTLAYAIPIVEILSSRVVTRLRALIVLPTRDLVTQVRETFELISKGRGLKIGSATGQHSFVHEQSHLVADQSPHICGGSSKVDILICTPGRLMDHLNETANFSLQHLRFLVIDEADRLLAQSFQDWLAQVLVATRPPSSTKDVHVPILSTYPFIDSVSPPYSCLLPLPQLPCDLTEKKESSCQKLLFSATLTRDPGKIAALELREPKYFNVQDKIMSTNEAGSLSDMTERFFMPTTLREHMAICESLLKPLVFFHLVYTHSVTSALVFTKSTESTARLVQLFEYFEESQAPDVHLSICAYSSDLSASDRKSILEKFKTQEIQILVCSDLISRGIDIQHVSHVISYDAPIDMRKYVHRVGRTARAGRTGDAWTLVEEQEAHHFKRMLREVNHLDKVKRLKISTKETESLMPHYEAALKKLKTIYTRE